jgi:hypothetical protein
MLSRGAESVSRFSVIALLLSITSRNAAAVPFALRAGDLYGSNSEGTLHESDPMLNPVASIHLPNSTTVSGIAFNRQGNLVCSSHEVNANQSHTHHVVEVNESGQLLHDLDLGNPSLDRASHIDVDSAGRIYVATAPNVIEIAPDFSSYRTLNHFFSRSSRYQRGLTSAQPESSTPASSIGAPFHA